MNEHRPCAAEECPRSVLVPRLLCTRHWRAAGEPHRRRILAAQVGGETSPEFVAALLAAVEALAAAEGRREPSAFPDFQTEVMR